jgi:LytS/YehU family sensor histidine kinase
MGRTYTNSEFEDILIYFTHSILGKNTEEEIAWDLAKNCISRLGFVDCVVYFLDEENNVLVQKAAFGPKNPADYNIAQPIMIPVGKGITGSVAYLGRSEIVADTTKDERYIVDDEMRFSEISVPIIFNNHVLGVIDCEHPEKNFFTEQHKKILEAIASICSIKISNVKAQKAIQEKQQNLLSIQQELLMVKAEALRSQMNPHFVFNAINAIQYFITAGDKKTSLKFLNTFSQLIRYYLNNFEKDFISIKNEIQLIRWYLQLQKIRYVDRFDYWFVNKLSEAEVAHKIPTMILGSVIESVIETTIFNNSTHGLAKVTINFIKGKLRLSAIHTVSKNEKINRSLNYREGLANWEEQIEVINRLKGLQIQKETRNRKLTNQNHNVRQIKIYLPVAAHENSF